MASKDKTKEEPKEALPPGHASAGYTAPDLSASVGAGTLPDAEQKWHDERDDAQAAEAEAVADAEDKVVKEERAKQEKADKEASKEDASAVTKTTQKA